MVNGSNLLPQPFGNNTFFTSLKIGHNISFLQKKVNAVQLSNMKLPLQLAGFTEFQNLGIS